MRRAAVDGDGGGRLWRGVSTAGYVDNGVRSEAEALATPFCRMFDNIAGAAEAHLPPPGRAIFTGGITVLDVPGVAPPTAIQSLLTSRAPQYVAHQVNHARLERSKLDWTLLCPGYLVDAPGCDKSTGCEPGEEPLRLSVDTLPAFPPETRFRPWQLKRPLKYPFVLLPFRLREEEWTVPYESVAAVLVNHLEAGGGLSRARVGLANPPGVRLKKTQAARKRERKVRQGRVDPHSVDPPARSVGLHVHVQYVVRMQSGRVKVSALHPQRRVGGTSATQTNPVRAKI